jgi:DNA-directed RNA polymerase specialized sigma24 family protein
LVGSGFTAPSLPSSVVVTVVVLGVSVAFIGATFPWIQELEIGPSGLKAKLKAIDASAPLLVDIEQDAVMRFALLTCADAAQARESVEKALAKTAERRLPREERDMYTLRRLIDLLDSAADRRWLHQHDPAPPVPDRAGRNSTQVIEILQTFSFFQRVCFLLRTELDLVPAEVGAVLECSTEDVTEAITAVRSVVLPPTGPRGGLAR